MGQGTPSGVPDGYQGQGGGYLSFTPPGPIMSPGHAVDGSSIYTSVLLGLVLLLVAWILNAVYRFMVSDIFEYITLIAARVLTIIGAIVITLGLLRGALVGPAFTDRMRLGMLVAAGLLMAALV